MKYRLITIIALALTGQLVNAADITDEYAIGDTLTTTTMDNIKTAVNSKQNQVDPLGCPVNSSIRVINADGSVTCEVDSIGSGDITSVDTAVDSGLAGGSTSGSVNLRLASGFISVPPAAFMPRFLFDAICHTVTNSQYHYYSSSGTTTSCGSFAPVNLPHNADISSLQCYLRDSHTEDITVTFRRTTLSTGSLTTIATLNTIGVNTTAILSRSSKFTSQTVDNSTYAYSIEFDPGNTTVVTFNHRIYGCSIGYSY